MRLTQERFNLKDLGIEALKPRRARTGALILEIGGISGVEKANRLVAGPFPGLRVAQTIKTAEIRVRNLDETMTPGRLAWRLPG